LSGGASRGSEADDVVVRPYRPGDAPALCHLFHASVHGATAAHYSGAERSAWAPIVPDAELWAMRMAARHTFVAERAGQALGFVELEDDGHVAMLYVHPSIVGQGLGGRLYDVAEARARFLGLRRLFTEASYVARPLFAARGFRVVRENRVDRRGVMLTNFSMEKDL
jgi:putative acetyltransferase